MLVKLFVLGRPGCGKSKTAEYVAVIVKREGWTTHRFKDYDILEKMFKEDVSQVRFRPSEYGGFDVKDAHVFEEVLTILEKKVCEYIASIEENAFIIIEFAREDYHKAFALLSQDFLQEAHFLLIDTELETCKQRIHKRIIDPTSSDDHFVSDFALNTYYREQHLPKDNMIKERFKEVGNQGSWDDFTEEINLIIKNILKKH